MIKRGFGIVLGLSFVFAQDFVAAEKLSNNFGQLPKNPTTSTSANALKLWAFDTGVYLQGVYQAEQPFAGVGLQLSFEWEPASQ